MTSLEASEVALSATSLEDDLVSVDTAAPVVLHVTSPNKDDVYGDKALITLYVTFSAPVVITGRNVVGELQLALTAGTGPAYYVRGNGTAVPNLSTTSNTEHDIWKFGLRGRHGEAQGPHVLRDGRSRDARSQSK